MKMALHGLTWVLTLTVVGTRATGQVTFSDEVFAASDWVALKWADNTPGQTGSFVVSQELAGGNPDEYRRTSLTFTGSGAGQTGISVLHYRPGDVYDPSAGGIASIEFAFDVIKFSHPSAGSATTFQPAVIQDDILYESAANIMTPQFSWVSYSVTLRECDFIALRNLVDGTPASGQPDFSAAGSPVTVAHFGSVSTGTSGSPVTRISGIDNFEVTLQTVGALAGSASYGQGWAGSLGVPTLSVVGRPVLGREVTVQATNSRGVDALGLLLAASAPASIPVGPGAELLVNPAGPCFRAFLVVPAGGLAFPATVPCREDLAGVSAYLQLLQLDPGALGGIAFTPGIQLDLGDF